MAYDLNGAVRWTAGNRQASYASPIVTTLAGERQIISVNEGWVTAHRWRRCRALGTPLVRRNRQQSKVHAANSARRRSPVLVQRIWRRRFAVAIETTTRHSTARPLWNPAIVPVMKTKFANVVVRDGFIYG